MTVPVSSAARRRVRPNSSITEAVTTSSSEIADVSAPTASTTKKNRPMIRPSGPIASNALGTAMNSAPTVLALTASCSANE